MRRLFALLCMVMLLSACEKKNPNLEPPPPASDKQVDHHHFDGGETDPYARKGDKAEAAAAKAE
jgi:hypothetical protein